MRSALNFLQQALTIEAKLQRPEVQADQNQYEGAEHDVNTGHDQTEGFEETQERTANQDHEREEQGEIDVVLHGGGIGGG